MHGSLPQLLLLTLFAGWPTASGTANLQWLPYALQQLDGYILTSTPNFLLNEFITKKSGTWGVVFSDLPLLLENDNLAKDFTEANGPNVIAKSAGILRAGRLQISFVGKTFSCINLDETSLLLSHNRTFPMLFSTDVFEDTRPGSPAINYWLPEAGAFAPTSALGSCVLTGLPEDLNSSVAEVVAATTSRQSAGVPLWDSHSARLSNNTFLQDVELAQDLLLRPKQFWKDLPSARVILTSAAVQEVHLKRQNRSLRIGPGWNITHSRQVLATMFRASLEQSSGIGQLSPEELGVTATSPPPPAVATNAEITLACITAFGALAIIDILDVRRSSNAAYAVVVVTLVVIGSTNVLPLIFLLVQDLSAANYVGTSLSGGATISAIRTTSAADAPDVYAIGVDLTMARVGVSDARVTLIATLTAVAIVAVAVQFTWTLAKVIRCMSGTRKVRHAGGPEVEQSSVDESETSAS